VSTPEPNTPASVGGRAVENEHVPALDGLRGLAVLAVMLMHFTILTPMLLSPAPLLNRIVVDIASAGWIGVDLFFVLSGFLITGILYDARESREYFRNFYMRRVLRIFPLYFATLIVLFVIVPWAAPNLIHHEASTRASEVWIWTYLSNWRIADIGNWMAVPPLTGHFWSLAVEEQFYFIWPWIVLWASGRTLIRLCASVVVIAFGLRVIAMAAGTNTLAIFVATPTRMDSLAVGALIAVGIRSETPDFWRRVMIRAGILGGAALGIYAGITGTLGQFDVGMQSAGYTLLALTFGGLLVWTLGAGFGSPLQRLLALRGLRYIGTRSYALYVLHPLVVMLLFRVWFAKLGTAPPRDVAWQAGFWILATLASMAAAEMSWQLLERRCLALKRFFPR